MCAIPYKVAFKWMFFSISIESVTFSIFHFILSFMCGIQKRLMDAVRLFERRVQWLNRTGSQQIWGTVCEQR